MLTALQQVAHFESIIELPRPYNLMREDPPMQFMNVRLRHVLISRC